MYFSFTELRLCGLVDSILLPLVTSPDKTHIKRKYKKIDTEESFLYFQSVCVNKLYGDCVTFCLVCDPYKRK